MRKPEDITAYEAQVLIGTSISGCTMLPDRTFDLRAAWAQLYAMKLIDRTDGLAIATPEGVALIASMLSPQSAIMAAEKRGEERERGACLSIAVDVINGARGTGDNDLRSVRARVEIAIRKRGED